MLLCWALALASLAVAAVLDPWGRSEWPWVLAPLWCVLGAVEVWLSEREYRRISEMWRRFWEAGR